jgi:CRP/FNR family transcriptional regulator, cyclic AMP receptor protein
VSPKPPLPTSDDRAGKPLVFEPDEPAHPHDDSATRQAAISTALAGVFRGKFCDAILPNRKVVTFEKDDVIYDVGDSDRTFFFLQSGFVKLGTITPDGHELIYDVRKGGDVIGELCAAQRERPDRALTLERTEAIPVPYREVMEVLRKQPDLLDRLVEVFCGALTEAYEQVSSLAVDDTVHRLVKALLRLGAKIGHRSGQVVDIPTYFTQEEISQMVAARRETVSTALNVLRRRGMVRYSNQGHLTLDTKALESYGG